MYITQNIFPGSLASFGRGDSPIYNCKKWKCPRGGVVIYAHLF